MKTNYRLTLITLFVAYLIGLLPLKVQAQTDVLKTFDAFCELFDQNYASFEEKKIDWMKGCSQSRKQLNEKSSEDELFRVMTELLRPLNDAHVVLRATTLEANFSASRPSRIIEEIKSIPGPERRPLFRAMTEATLSAHGFGPIQETGPKYKGEKLFSYTKNNKIGYLRYTRSFSNGAGLNKQLDEIFKSFTGLEGLVIDIRFNIGGNDSFSQKVAGYLIKETSLGFHKQTLKNKKFQALKTHYIKPSNKYHFGGNVVLLTNDKTVSAADVMALMLSEMPQATLIGEPSNGSYSDLSSYKLPNGWRISLSNQRYLSPVLKKNYEGFGTPVDIEVKNMLSDIEKQEDAVLLSALEHLKKTVN